MNINWYTLTNSFQLTTMTETKTGVTLNPTSASPVLKTMVNITLESTFPYTLAREDFSVNATNISSPEYFRQMNVVAVDDANKMISVMFGGAHSGDYAVNIRHSAYGLVDTEGLIFNVGSTVTSVSPQTGSIYGGTLVTIQGTNFGTVATDNPVQISTLGAVGSIDCLVQTTSANEITCRVAPTVKADGTTGKMITFLKVSEEAVCTPNSTCTWTYNTPTATVTGAAAAWNSVSG